jgi:hypothetical protein
MPCLEQLRSRHLRSTAQRCGEPRSLSLPLFTTTACGPSGSLCRWVSERQRSPGCEQNGRRGLHW